MKMLASFGGYSRNGLFMFVPSSKTLAFLARSVQRDGFLECQLYKQPTRSNNNNLVVILIS